MKSNAKVAMNAAAASRWNAGSIIIDLMLEDLDESIE
jgi:hypothetical protein